MSINCTVTPGHSYGPRYTVDYADLNKLGNPTVTVPDGGIMQFERITVDVGNDLAPSIRFSAEEPYGIYSPAPYIVGIAGALALGEGTISDPSLTFAFDLATGLYLAGPGQVGVAGSLALGDGSAGAPSLTFTNDPETGFCRPGPDAFAAVVTGDTVATFSPAGIDAVGLSIAGSPVALKGPDILVGSFFSDMALPYAAEGWTATLTGSPSISSGGDANKFGTILIVAGNICQAQLTGPMVRLNPDGSFIELRIAVTGSSEASTRFRSTIGISQNNAAIVANLATLEHAVFQHDVNTGPNWVAKSRTAGGTITSTPTSAPYRNTIAERFRIRRSGTTTIFSINGVDVATHANMTLSNSLVPVVTMEGLMAATYTNTDIDWMWIKIPTTSRA